MRKLLFVIFVLFLSNIVHAQNKDFQLKVPIHHKGYSDIYIKGKISLHKENKLVNIYLFKNTKVKKALAFVAMQDKAKLA